MRINLVLASLAVGMIAFVPAANATIVGFTGAGVVNSQPYTVDLSLNVLFGHASSGTGTLTGAGLASPETLTLVTPLSPGVKNDGPLLFGYTSNDATLWDQAGTVFPINIDGLVFAFGGPVGFETSSQFDLYAAGGNYFASFFGAASPGVPAFHTDSAPISIAFKVPEVPSLPIAAAGLVLAWFFAGRRGRVSKSSEAA